MDSFYLILSALIANVCAQVLKPLFLYFRTKKFDFYQTVASGGFPSSHSATVSALSMACAVQYGLDSPYFAIAVVFSVIVIYDAVNVRYYAGRNIQLTRQLIQDLEEQGEIHLSAPIYDEKMKGVLGHKLIEAIGGIVLGILVTMVWYPFFIGMKGGM